MLCLLQKDLDKIILSISGMDSCSVMRQYDDHTIDSLFVNTTGMDQRPACLARNPLCFRIYHGMDVLVYIIWSTQSLGQDLSFFAGIQRRFGISSRFYYRGIPAFFFFFHKFIIEHAYKKGGLMFLLEKRGCVFWIIRQSINGFNFFHISSCLFHIIHAVSVIQYLFKVHRRQGIIFFNK